MSHFTPKRARRGGEAEYVRYNGDPKTVGTRSNAPMPSNVPRLSDGFEDPAAFFASPTGQTEIGSRSIISTFTSTAMTPKTPGARSDYTSAGTPMTGETGTSAGFGTLRKNRSTRLSDLGFGDDDQVEEDVDDLLDDEDDLHPATPGRRYFPESNPPSVTLPSRSRVSASSPAVNRSYDSLPSPRASHSVARSPRKSTLSSHSRVTPAKSTRNRVSDVTETDQNENSPFDRTNDSFGDIQNQNSSPLRSSTRGKSKRLSESPNTNKKTPSASQSKKNNSRVLDSQPDAGLEEEEPIDGELSFEDDQNDETTEHSRERRNSTKSLAASSRKSNVTSISNADFEREGSVSDNDNGPSYNDDTRGFDETVQDISIGNDTNDIQEDGGDISALVDDMAHENGPQSYNDDDGDGNDVSLEEAAIAEENEEEESTPVQRKRKLATKPRKVLQPKKRDENIPTTSRRGLREGSVAAKPKKTRVSQIGVGDELDENDDGYHGDFTTRRSNRTHFKPLQWWRGEKFEYQPGHGLAVIKEVVHIPEEVHAPLSQVGGRHRSTNGKSRGRSVSVNDKRKKSRRSSDSDESDLDDGAGQGGHAEDGWDAQTEPTGLVKTYPGGWESHRKIACPKALLAVPDPAKRKNQSFHYQKVFGEGDFMAAGVVFIPIGSKKAPKPSKDNAYVFYVIQGAVQVTIYRTSFVMAPGGQFLVPRGNDYCIENISPDREVQLFFAQARKIRADEEEMVDQPPPGYISDNANGKRSSSVISNLNNTSTSTSVPTKKQKKLGHVREEDDGVDDY